MKSWLEEIEENAQQKEDLSTKAQQRILLKKEKSALNYQQNAAFYDDFISKINQLADKVNKFPDSQQKDFYEIDARFKDTEFNNKLFVLSSSKRVSSSKMIFYFFGKQVFRFKHIRVIYFSVSKEMGKVDIEYKEKFLPKGHHEKYAKDDSHFLYELDFDILTTELAYRIINWLAFKEGEAEFSLNS